MSPVEWDAEAIIIGSGFGGAVAACRLGRAWPGRVLVIERGKRYGFGDFPRTPHGMATNFFNVNVDSAHPRPRFVPKDRLTGLFDLRSYDKIDVVQAAGVGGGSLIYANVFMEPPEAIFDERWPLKKNALLPYYAVAREVLGANAVPGWSGAKRKVVRTAYFQETAKAMGRDSELTTIMVNFGEENAPFIGQQLINRYGARQSACNYCAECDLGCNTSAKNSVDFNYLHVAETRYGVKVMSEHMALNAAPLGADGQVDLTESGAYGYAVTIQDLSQAETRILRCKKLVVAAGTLNTGEFLLRCRDQFKSLPRLSPALGEGFSGNGDFLSFIIDSNREANPNYGPVITQRIDYNLFKDFKRGEAFIMEDASYPSLVAWFVEGQKPIYFKLAALWAFIKGLFQKLFVTQRLGRMGYLMSKLLGDDLSSHSSVHLCMGQDASDGRLSVDPQSKAFSLHWPQKTSMPLYLAIDRAMREFCRTVQGRIMFHMPTWTWPFRRNVTVHPLGGCRIGFDPTQSVTSAKDENFGQVHGYANLYVSDASLIPSALGANPVATICALAEKVAFGITGRRPDADL